MAFNLPNFLGVPTQGYGPEGLLESLMQGYQAGRMPAQMQNQEAQQREMLEQLMLGNQGKRTELEFQRPELEGKQDQLRAMIEQLTLGNEASRTKNRYLEPELEQKRRQSEADIIKQELMNRFLPEQQQAEIAQKQAQARHAHLAHMTQAERDVMAMIGPEKLRTPEGQRLVAALNRVSPEDIGQGNPDLPKGAKSMAHWPQAAVTKEFDRQNAELDKIQQIKVMKSGIQDARDIMAAYPDMWRNFSIILSDPDNDSKISRIIGALNDEDKRTAAIQFAKITSSIINRSAEGLGARGTNLRVKLLQKEKPSLFNTPAGNNYMFDKLEEEFDPQLAREPALLAAQGMYALPRTFEHKKVKSKHLAKNDTVTPRQAENRISGNSEKMGGLVPGFYNGKPTMVHPDNMELFKQKGGVVP